MLLCSALVECPLNIGVGGMFPLKIWVHHTHREDFTPKMLEELEAVCSGPLIVREEDCQRGFYIEGHAELLLSVAGAMRSARKFALVVEKTLNIPTTIGYNDRVQRVRRLN